MFKRYVPFIAIGICKFQFLRSLLDFFKRVRRVIAFGFRVPWNSYNTKTTFFLMVSLSYAMCHLGGLL